MFEAAIDTEQDVPPIKEPYNPRPIGTKASPQWTPDEDDALWNLSKEYNQNWAVIADTLNSMRIGTGHGRSEWDCYDRYVTLSGQSFKPNTRSDYLYCPPTRSCKSILNDKKMKALQLLNTFELITKCARKRENQRIPCKLFLNWILA